MVFNYSVKLIYIEHVCERESARDLEISVLVERNSFPEPAGEGGDALIAISRWQEIEWGLSWVTGVLKGERH